MACNFMDIKDALLLSMKKPRWIFDFNRKKTNKNFLDLMQYCKGKKYYPFDMREPDFKIYDALEDCIYALKYINDNLCDVEPYGVLGLSYWYGPVCLVIIPMTGDTGNYINMKIRLSVDVFHNTGSCEILFDNDSSLNYEVKLGADGHTTIGTMNCTEKCMIAYLNKAMHMIMTNIIRYAYKVYT